ncbi:MAG TPA: 5-(carboxyamino)imidazole ribonucleotide synthase [Phycisphaerales bacterium]|nr:5-(carboxyamino)imidazole ribonucleotide synthase [Phycisphaerales bacterium]
MKVGVLGGGQLGRMLALAGYPLEMRFRFLDHKADAPAGQVGELIVGEFDDATTLDRFAAGLDVVTVEFENVPSSALKRIEDARRAPVYPPVKALETAQDRLLEKQLFERIGLAVPPYRAVSSLDELRGALDAIGLPAILKTRRMGYDGKGQIVIRAAAEIDAAWKTLGASRELIVEQMVKFDREVSILGVRGRGGEKRFYPLVENVHREGILRVSRAPASGNIASLQASAEQAASRVMDELGYVGVLAIELFDLGGKLLGNEMAPRVHNSGHWTIEGAATSQFENHLRAVCGLPLGDCSARGHAAMINLIGEMPEAPELLAMNGAHVHLYGKAPKPGRKIGHVTLVDQDEKKLAARVNEVRKLTPSESPSA